MPVDPRLLEALEGPHGMRPAGTFGPTKKKGYADWPGTGPEGERCKTCGHRRTFGIGRRNVSKCALTETRSKTTDINSRSPACRRWSAIHA